MKADQQQACLLKKMLSLRHRGKTYTFSPTNSAEEANLYERERTASSYNCESNFIVTAPATFQNTCVRSQTKLLAAARP
ncbi:MAG: hypothetical protein ACREXR_18145, partial [Gammaproteobacteria bacterium]